MFTGIIEEIGRVISVSERRLRVSAFRVVKIIKIGDSIAVNGVCLTVTDFDSKKFEVDIMPETSKRSNLELLHADDRVNLENALTLQKSLGGHLVQGHVDTTGKVASQRRVGESTLIRIDVSNDFLRYVVEKGFVAVDGISLTVVERDEKGFSVSIVNHTFGNTTLGNITAGYEVNLEADIIAKYVERFLQKDKEPITMDFLNEHGF